VADLRHWPNQHGTGSGTKLLTRDCTILSQ
jgi:hypothetical protein